MSRMIPILSLVLLLAAAACSDRSVAPPAAGGLRPTPSPAAAIGAFGSAFADPAPQAEPQPAVEPAEGPSPMGQINTLRSSDATQPSAMGQINTVRAPTAVAGEPTPSAMGERSPTGG